LTWLWWRVLTPKREVGWSILLTAVALTILYGISDEIHQRFVPGRHGQLSDVLFDTGGALAMILFIRRIRWLRSWPETFGFSLTRGLKKGM
jgi:VanZ family protein